MRTLAHASQAKLLIPLTLASLLGCGEGSRSDRADGGQDAADGGDVVDVVDTYEDAGPCEPLPCASRQQWDEARCACVPRYDARCDLGALVDERFQGVDAVDCGTLAWDSEADAQAVAVGCVKDALAMQRPLRMIWWLPGIDSAVATAALVDDQGKASILSYDSDPSGGSGAGQVIWELQCTALAVKDDCTPSVDDSCITCARDSDYEVVCQEAPSSEWADAGL